MLRRLPLILLAALTLAVAAAGPASATDSHAPKGARGDWLPSDEWVMSSWLPYDEARLDALLHTDRHELSTWLDDKRSLGQLAARRGFHDTGLLAARLVQTRIVSSRLRHVLIRRAMDTLTQPHLTRHLLFHPYHTSALAPAAPQVFDVQAATFVCMRNAGATPLTIIGVGGGDEARLKANLLRFFRERGARAIRIGAMSRAQAAALLGEQEHDLGAFVHRAYRTPAQQDTFAKAEHHFGPNGDSLQGMP